MARLLANPSLEYVIGRVGPGRVYVNGCIEDSDAILEDMLKIQERAREIAIREAGPEPSTILGRRLRIAHARYVEEMVLRERRFEYPEEHESAIRMACASTGLSFGIVYPYLLALYPRVIGSS